MSFILWVLHPNAVLTKSMFLAWNCMVQISLLEWNKGWF